MPDHESLLLRRIEVNAARAAAAGREAVRVGPFLATFHPTSDLIWFNYALPAPGHEEEPLTEDHLAELRRLFAERGRRLRFEFLEPLWPELGLALERAGLELQGRMPFMICGPDELRPVAAPGVEVQGVREDAEDAVLAEFILTARLSFGMEQKAVEAHQIAEEREVLRAGQARFGMGRVGGQAAGVGTMMVLGNELAGVGTLPEFRRRGVAATVSSFLVEEHFRGGGELVWLSAGDGVAYAVYHKIGFRPAGVQLNYLDREPSR